MKRDKEDLGIEAVRLRRQAEARLKKNGTEKTLPRTTREAEKLLHELEVHCIELEMQNEELREKAFKYRTLIEETTNVVFAVDKDGRYDFVNHVFASAFGKPPEFFCGKTYWDVYPKELAEVRFEATRKVFETGEVGTLEVSVPLPDQTKYYLATLNPLIDSRGNVTLVLVHSTDITKRRQAEDALRRSAEMQTVLREIAEAALLSPSMDELYQTVYRLIGRVLPTNIFLFNLLDETTGEIVVPFHGDDAHSVPARRPIGKGMTEYVLRQGRAIYVSPSEMDRLRASGEYLLANEQKLKMRHYLGAPLIDSQGKAFGVLSMGENQAFQPKDVEALSIIAAQVSFALERKQAKDALLRNTQIQTILKEIAEAMVLSASMDELYRTVYKLLGRVLPAKLFHINLLDEASNEIVVPFQADDITFIPARRPVGKGMTEYIMRLGRAVHITPEEQDRLSETGEYGLAKVQKVKMRHYLGAPLIDSQGKAFGVMSLITMGEEQPFQPQDVEVLSIIAAQVSMAIERKLAEEKSRESEQRYRAIMQQSSDAISLVDPETKRFIEVNESWVRMLGYTAEEALGLSVYSIIDDTTENIDRGYSEVHRDSSITVLRRLRRKDGKVIEVERAATQIEFGGKQVLLFANRDLSAERKLQELILKDVALASDVQKTLVPPGFDDVLVTVKTIYVPYHMVSGDFYDYAWSSDHQRLTGFVLDISGHGVSSSLQGIAVSTYFRDVLDSPMRLDAKLRWVNQRVMRYFTDETYAAAIYFEFDFVSRMLHFATAGIYGFMASSADLPTIVRKAGSLVGITADPDYSEWTVPIQEGDAFYFMSDGIFEQTDAIQALPVDDFEGAVDRLRALANELPVKDDCSALCIRVNGALSFPHRFEFHRYGDVGRIRQRLRNLIQGVAREEAGKIFIALGEALNNATQESMDVQVKMNRFGRRLVFRIKDGGAGFDGNERVAAFTKNETEGSFEERLFAEGGRGILIMVSWMDRVIYNRQGNEVLLMKRMCI